MSKTQTDEQDDAVSMLSWLEVAIGEAFWDTMREIDNCKAAPNDLLMIRANLARIGDVLWGNSCPKCDGTGEVSIPTGEVVSCGNCRDGIIPTWEDFPDS